MKHLLGLVIVSATVSMMFASALVLAQVPVAGFAPTPIGPAKKALNDDRPPTPKAAAPAEAVAKKQPPFRKPAIANARLANLDNQIQQFMQQGRPAVRAELIFVRRVCRLDKEPLKRISQDAEAALKKVATEMVEAQQQGRMPVQVRKGKGTPQSPRNLDGLSSLREELESVMKKHLATAQFADYHVAVEKRHADRKRAAIDYLVNSIDQDLYLSDEQRIKLTESLSSHWDESWGMTLEYLLYGNQFQPQGIDPFVTPYLNAAQAKVWQGGQRVGGIGGLFGVWGGFLNDNDALEDELGEPKKPEPAKNARMLRRDMMKIQIVPMQPAPVERKNAVVKEAAPKK